MRKLLFPLVAFAMFFLCSCGASKVDIERATSKCDILVEVRELKADSVSWFVGNTIYLNPNQAKREDMFPMIISTRSPANIDMQRSIDFLNDESEFLKFINKKVPDAMNFGMIFNDKVISDLGVDEDKTVDDYKSVFKKIKGGSMVVFYEKNGVITDMSSVY